MFLPHCTLYPAFSDNLSLFSPLFPQDSVASPTNTSVLFCPFVPQTTCGREGIIDQPWEMLDANTYTSGGGSPVLLDVSVIVNSLCTRCRHIVSSCHTALSSAGFVLIPCVLCVVAVVYHGVADVQPAPAWAHQVPSDVPDLDHDTQKAAPALRPVLLSDALFLPLCSPRGSSTGFRERRS